MKIQVAAILIFTYALVGCSNTADSFRHVGSSGLAQTVIPQVVQGQQPPSQWLQFYTPTAAGNQWGYDSIAVGPNHTLWFTEFAKNSVAEVDMTGAIKEFAVGQQPQNIIQGPDKNLWFTLYPANGRGFICRIDRNGLIATYPVVGNALSLTIGADGRVWYVLRSPDLTTFQIGAISIYGVTSAYPLSLQGQSVNFIAQGPDGNTWFTSSVGQNGYISKISPQGIVTDYSVGSGVSASQLVAGRDGKVWFDEFRSSGGSGIGRINADGSGAAFFLTPANPIQIVQGQLGVMWLIGYIGNAWEIDRMSESGQLTRYAAPSSDIYLSGLAYGPDGNLWVPDAKNGAVDVFVRRLLTVSPTSLSLAVGQAATLSVSETGYSGTFTATGCSASIAIISMTGPGTFKVTAAGSGYCTITVRDAALNSTLVPVHVN